MQQQTVPAVVLDDSVAGLRWSDPRYPWMPLDRSTALQYFEISPFCEPNSNNNAARKQGLDPAVDGVLSSMPAQTTEYALAERAEPHLFVIRKQQRELLAANMQKTSTHKYYYTLGWQERHIYQAPTLQAVVNARLRRSMHFVKEGFKRFKADIAPLPKVLREHMLEQEALQRQQLETLVAMDTDVEAAPPAAARETSSTGAAAAAAGLVKGAAAAAATGESAIAAAAAAAAAAKPVAVPEILDEADQDRWVKTDNIIMSVLCRYPQPRLPKSKAELEQENKEKQAAEAAAAATAAAEKEKAAAEKKAAEEQAAQEEAAAAQDAAAAAAALAAAAAAEAEAAAAVQRGSKGKRQRPTFSDGVPAAAAATGGGGKAVKRQRTPTPPPPPAAASAAADPAQMQEQQHVMQQQQYVAQQPPADLGMLAAQYNPNQHPLLQQQQQQSDRHAAAAAAPSVSYGGGMSASMGGTAMTAGTAATASGLPGRKLKLKFKKGLPGAGQQQQQPPQ